jgi:hypothetical protein
MLGMGHAYRMREQPETVEPLSSEQSLSALLFAVSPSAVSRLRPLGISQQVYGQRSPAASMERIEVGSAVPSVELDFGFPPEKVNIEERTKGKRTILVGLPGAFTPT